MSWFGKKMLKIAGLATVLGVGGGTLKNPAESKATNSDNNGQPIEQVVRVNSDNNSSKNNTVTDNKIKTPWGLGDNEVGGYTDLGLNPFDQELVINHKKRLVAELTQLQFADLLERNIVDKEFLANYEYTPKDMQEMRNKAGDDAKKLERSFKKWRSGKNHSQCLGGVNETFGMILGVRIPCETNKWGEEIRWASKAQLDKVEPLFYMGIYNKDGKGNIAKDVIQQSAYVVTQFNKGKEGCQGHIGYNCFVGATQYEYSDGRQLTSSSLNRMGGYYGTTCKVYGLKSTKVPSDMANEIVERLMKNENYYTLVSGDLFKRLGVEFDNGENQYAHSLSNEQRVKKAKIRAVKKNVLADMRSKNNSKQNSSITLAQYKKISQKQRV